MALGKEGPVGQVEDVGHHFLRKSVTITITSANTKIVNSANSEISDSVMASSRSEDNERRDGCGNVPRRPVAILSLMPARLSADLIGICIAPSFQMHESRPQLFRIALPCVIFGKLLFQFSLGSTHPSLAFTHGRDGVGTDLIGAGECRLQRLNGICGLPMQIAVIRVILGALGLQFTDAGGGFTRIFVRFPSKLSPY